MSGRLMPGRKPGTLSPGKKIERPVAISIENAHPQDAGQIARLHAQALPPGWPAAEIAAACTAGNRIVLKATDGTVLLGFAILQCAADEAEILAIAVAEQARRQRIATGLLEAALEALGKRLIARVYLEVSESNEPAVTLYQMHGFSMAGRRKDYYRAETPAPETALIMKLDTRGGLTQIDGRRGST